MLNWYHVIRSRSHEGKWPNRCDLIFSQIRPNFVASVQNRWTKGTGRFQDPHSNYLDLSLSFFDLAINPGGKRIKAKTYTPLRLRLTCLAGGTAASIEDDRRGVFEIVFEFLRPTDARPGRSGHCRRC